MKFKLRNTSRESGDVGRGEEGWRWGAGAKQRWPPIYLTVNCWTYCWASLIAQEVPACNAEDMGSIPGSGRSSGGVNGNLPSILA